jgi:hypothetical protein
VVGEVDDEGDDPEQGRDLPSLAVECLEEDLSPT